MCVRVHVCVYMCVCASGAVTTGYPLQTEVSRDAGIAALLVVGVVIYFLLVAENSSRNRAILGVICNIFTVLFFSSPLASMVGV